MNICTMNEGFQMPPLIVHVEKLSNKLLVEGIFQGRIALRNCNGGVTFILIIEFQHTLDKKRLR